MKAISTRGTALAKPQPIGRIIRRRELAELASRSTRWVDYEASREGSVLVKVRNSAGFVLGFTEESVRRLLGCPVNREGGAI